MRAGLVGQLVTGFRDLIFAPVCLGCRGAISAAARDRRICGVCWSRLRRLPEPRCERCWNPQPTGVPGVAPATCAVCATLPPSLRAVRSAFVHGEPLRQLIHALKYGGWWSIAAPLARQMAQLEFPMETTEEARLVVPVPLSAARMRMRGFNQAVLLAEEVATIRGLQLAPNLLRRVRSAGSQTTLHPSERRANVAGAFAADLSHVDSLGGEHVLLVDDVWTTGATAVACGDALLQAGARAYSVVTLARALPELNR